MAKPFTFPDGWGPNATPTFSAGQGSRVVESKTVVVFDTGAKENLTSIPYPTKGWEAITVGARYSSIVDGHLILEGSFDQITWFPWKVSKVEQFREGNDPHTLATVSSRVKYPYLRVISNTLPDFKEGAFLKEIPPASEIQGLTVGGACEGTFKLSADAGETWSEPFDVSDDGEHMEAGIEAVNTYLHNHFGENNVDVVIGDGIFIYFKEALANMPIPLLQLDVSDLVACPRENVIIQLTPSEAPGSYDLRITNTESGEVKGELETNVVVDNIVDNIALPDLADRIKTALNNNKIGIEDVLVRGTSLHEPEGSIEIEFVGDLKEDRNFRVLAENVQFGEIEVNVVQNFEPAGEVKNVVMRMQTGTAGRSSIPITAGTVKANLYFTNSC